MSSRSIYRTPNGFDVAVARASVSSGQRRFIGVLSYEGEDLRRYAMRGLSGLARSEPEVWRGKWASVLLWWSVDRDSRWPAFGKLASEKHRRQMFHLEDQRTVVKNALGGIVAPETFATSDLLSFALDTYPTGNSTETDLARFHDMAVFGIPAGEYSGTVPPEKEMEIASQWVVDTIRDTQNLPPGELSERFMGQMYRLAEDEELERLEALHHVFMVGRRVAMKLLAAAYESALADVAAGVEAKNNNLGENAEIALLEGAGLHELFYQMRPEFGYQPWMVSLGTNDIRLRPPKVVDIVGEHDDRWLERLLTAFADGDEGDQPGLLAELASLTALVAVGRVTDRDGVRILDHHEIGKAPVVELPFDDPESPIELSPPFPDEHLLEKDSRTVLEGSLKRILTRRQLEVVLPLVFDSISQRKLAQQLGVTEGAVSQRIASARKRVEEKDPSLFERLCLLRGDPD